jgi:hypothetical protein
VESLTNTAVRFSRSAPPGAVDLFLAEVEVTISLSGGAGRRGIMGYQWKDKMAD